MCCAGTTAFAQSDDATNTFTPYSFYGLGDLARPGIAYNLGMGGIGTGVRTTRVINLINPAALTAHDSLSFMFDFGLETQNYYSASAAAGKTQHSASNSMNIHHIVMSFPVYNRVILGLGLLPYSSVGYDMQRAEDDPAVVAAAGHTYYRYTGEGGITQGVASIAAPIGKHLSIGGQAHYYFGSIDRYNIIDFEAGSGYSDLTAGQLLRVGNFGFSLGAQYEQPLKNGLLLAVGASYHFATKIGTRSIDFAYTTTGSLTDTVAWNTGSESRMSLPATVSAGFSLNKPDRWMFGLDYVFQQWRPDGFESRPARQSQSFKIVPGHLVRTGFEWTPSKTDFRNYYNRCSYRIGLSYESTYMQFSGRNIDNISATAGIGLPINRWNNSVNLSVEAGRRGTTSGGLIREAYVKFSVSFSVYDIWFIKPQIE
jgi:long-subunit fatty acid transport protein